MGSRCRSLRGHYQFFKVVLPSTLKDKKLRIPPKFVNIFRDELGCVAALTIPAGRVWTVGLEMDSGKSAWFGDGWEEFADHNCILPGYFLVFGYEGNSKFRVSVFDFSGCEVCYPDETLNGSTKQNHGKKFSVHPQEEEEDDDELQDDAHNEVSGSSPPWRTPASLKQRRKQGTFRNPSRPQKRGKDSPRPGLGVENHGRNDDPPQFTKSIRACRARGGKICSATEKPVKRNARTERAHDGRRPDPANLTIKPCNMANSSDDDDDDEEDEPEEEESSYEDQTRKKHESSGRVRARPSKGCHKKSRIKRTNPCHSLAVENSLCMESVAESGNPFFKTILRARKHSRLHIPSQVLKDYNIQFGPNIFLVDPLARSWRGDIQVWDDGRIWVGGWRPFCKWNNVKENDLCICELVLEEGKQVEVINVHINRA